MFYFRLAKPSDCFRVVHLVTALCFYTWELFSACTFGVLLSVYTNSVFDLYTLCFAFSLHNQCLFRLVHLVTVFSRNNRGCSQFALLVFCFSLNYQWLSSFSTRSVLLLFVQLVIAFSLVYTPVDYFQFVHLVFCFQFAQLVIVFSLHSWWLCLQ